MHDPQTEDALREFEQLAQLRGELQQILKGGVASLEPFYLSGSGGFAHRLRPTGTTRSTTHWSKSSTATCLAFLRATGLLAEGPWSQKTPALTRSIVSSEWSSAGLGEDNPFTVAFLLEALADLGGRNSLEKTERAAVNRKVAGLRKAMKAGGIALQDGFEPTAFLTYKAVSALMRWGGVRDAERVETWNWNHLHKESALVAAGSADADVFEVAYSVLIANAIKPLDAMSPQQRLLLRFGLKQFFDAQRPDGTWPRSRPLFVYPKLGHAYCFEYELLAAMLAESQLSRVLHEYLGALREAAGALDSKKYPLVSAAGSSDDAPYGWSSGHHGTDPRPESWSTASALHFCFGLTELVAEAIRRATFSYADAAYTRPRPQPGSRPYLDPKSFLDSTVKHDGRQRSLSRILTQRLLVPLIEEGKALKRGRPIPAGPPTSAIFYGPPGTSKTELAKLVARALGWPLLAIDPSHLTRRGLEQVHAEANTIFRMLEHCERIVVLLDEFDELMRDRDAGELESRFLTTAMLPKLAALSRERRIVYLAATNHLEQFDAAIRRPGRFDLIVPVMPPTTESKLRKWPVLDRAVKRIEAHDATAARRARRELHDLTFGEAKELAERVAGVKGLPALKEAIHTAGETCTLRQPVSPAPPAPATSTKWKKQIENQSDRIRGI